MNSMTLPEDFKQGRRSSLSDESRALYYHIRKTAASCVDAERVAVFFTNLYGDTAQTTFDLFHRRGWSAADIRDLMILGHRAWRRRPEWMLDAEAMLIERLGLDARQARKCVIMRRAYSDLEPERLTAGIETFRALSADPRHLAWIAENQPRAFYCETYQIEDWHALYGDDHQFLSQLPKLMRIAPTGPRPPARPSKGRPRKPKLAPVPATGTPASTEIPVAHAKMNPPPPEPATQKVVVKAVYDVFPPRESREPLDDPPDESFKVKDVERVLREAFHYRLLPRDEKRSKAPFYGVAPLPIAERLRELRDHTIAGKRSKSKSERPVNWGRLWNEEKERFTDHGRNILDIGSFFESSVGKDGAFLLHRILKRSELLAILWTPWRTLAMRLAVIRRRVGADVLAHPELLLWPFETLDDNVLRGRVNTIEASQTRTRDHDERKRILVSRRPFIDLIFAATDDSNAAFLSGLEQALFYVTRG